MSGQPKSQSDEANKGNPPKPRSAIVRTLRALKRYENRRRRRKTQHQTNQRMMARWTRVVGVFTAALVFVSVATAIIFGRQLSVMQGQLHEMQLEDRPWIGVDSVQSDVSPQTNTPFKILVVVKNFGKSPAPFVKACFGSDTPNVHQQDRQGIENMMTNALRQCSNLIETVLMPNGSFYYDVTRPSNWMTSTVVNDINDGFATFAAFGRIDYKDQAGKPYRTRSCDIYKRSSGHFNACIIGNEIH